MDNKKWYSRFGTIFWWVLTVLPLIVTLVHFIGYHFAFNSGISSATDLMVYQNGLEGDFFYLLSNYCIGGDFTFYEIQLPFINTMYVSLFGLLDIDSIGLPTLASLLGWMTSVAFYHLLFDFIVWLPRWMHNILEKGVGKID